MDKAFVIYWEIAQHDIEDFGHDCVVFNEETAKKIVAEKNQYADRLTELSKKAAIILEDKFPYPKELAKETFDERFKKLAEYSKKISGEWAMICREDLKLTEKEIDDIAHNHLRYYYEKVEMK